MKMKSCLLLLLATVLFTTTTPAPAAHPEVLKGASLVVAVAPLEQLDKNVGAVLKISDDPRARAGYNFVKSMAVSMVKGIDTKRAWGGTFQQSGGYLAVPVADWKKFDEGIANPMLQLAKKGDGGWYTFKGKKEGAKTFYGKPAGKWMLVSEQQSAIPKKMQAITKLAPLFAKLTKENDIVAKVDLSGVSTAERKKIIAKIDAGIQAKMKGRDAKIDRCVAKTGLDKKVLAKWHDGVVGDLQKKIETLILDADAMLVAGSLREGHLQLEAAFTAKSGSETAKKFAQMGKVKSQFSGFLQAESAIKGEFAGDCKLISDDQLNVFFDCLNQVVNKKIQGKVKDEGKASEIETLAGAWLGITQNYCLTGHHEGVVVLKNVDEGGCFLAARYIKQAKAVETTLFDTLDFLKKVDHEKFAKLKVKKNAQKAGEVAIHTCSFTLPKEGERMNAQKRARAVQFFGGEKVTIVLGVGEEALYLAVGKDAMKQLKAALRKSKSVPIAPAKVTVSTVEMLKFMANFGDSEKKREGAATILKSIDVKKKGEPGLSIGLTSIKDGAKIHFEMDPVTMRLAVEMHKREKVGEMKIEVKTAE